MQVIFDLLSRDVLHKTYHKNNVEVLINLFQVNSGAKVGKS